MKISLSNASKGYETTLFTDLNLAVESGSKCALLGPSGSGKTTLLQILALTETLDKGDLLLGETNTKDITRKHEFLRENIGVIYQSYNLMPEFTALENVVLPLLINGSDRSNKAEKHAKEILELLDMGQHTHKMPYQLSGGQKQRIGIARALITKPKIILADEPTGSLDPHNKSLVLKMLMEHASDVTLVIATHDHDIANMCDQTIDFGRKP